MHTIPVLFRCLLTVLALWCSISISASQTAPGAPAAVENPQPEVSTVDGKESLRVKGLLVPLQQARIASRSQGLIKRILREGDSVRSGDPLIELEEEMELLQVEQQERVLDLRQFEANSAAGLAEKNVISRTEAQEKRIALEIAKVQLEQARRLLERRKVPAPFDGVVTDRLRETGEAVDEFTPVLILANINDLYFETFLPASLRQRVREGATAEVRIPNADGSNGISQKGTIEKLAGVVNAASGEFKLRIRVPNPGRKLVAGVRAEAVLSLEKSASTSEGAIESASPAP